MLTHSLHFFIYISPLLSLFSLMLSISPRFQLSVPRTTRLSLDSQTVPGIGPSPVLPSWPHRYLLAIAGYCWPDKNYFHQTRTISINWKLLFHRNKKCAGQPPPFCSHRSSLLLDLLFHRNRKSVTQHVPPILPASLIAIAGFVVP